MINKRKNILAMIIMVLLFLSNVSETVYAGAYWKFVDQYTYTTGALWWKKTWICNVCKNSDDSYFEIYYGDPKVSTGFDYKKDKKSSIVISQTTSFSVGKETVFSLNSGIELKKAKVKAGVGGSLSSTHSATWGGLIK